MMTTKPTDMPSAFEVRHNNFSIGLLAFAEEPGQAHRIAIVLDAREGASPTQRDAVLLDDWDEVMAVVQGLIEAATKVWGLPPGAIGIKTGPPPTEH